MTKEWLGTSIDTYCSSETASTKQFTSDIRQDDHEATVITTDSILLSTFYALFCLHAGKLLFPPKIFVHTWKRGTIWSIPLYNIMCIYLFINCFDYIHSYSLKLTYQKTPNCYLGKLHQNNIFSAKVDVFHEKRRL